MKSIQQLKAIVGKNKEGGDKKGHSNRILLASIIVYTTAFPYKLSHVNDVHTAQSVSCDQDSPNSNLPFVCKLCL